MGLGSTVLLSVPGPVQGKALSKENFVCHQLGWDRLWIWGLRLLRDLVPADFYVLVDFACVGNPNAVLYVPERAKDKKVVKVELNHLQITPSSVCSRLEVANLLRNVLNVSGEIDFVQAKVVSDRLVALLIVGSVLPKGFNKRDKVAIKTVAQNVASVIQKQNMKRELRKVMDNIVALGEIGNLLTSTLVLEDVLSEMIEKIKATLNVDGVGVLLYDPETDELVLQKPAFNVVDDGIIGIYREPVSGDSNAAKVFRMGEPYISNNAVSDSRIIQKYVRLFGVRNTISVPLRIKNESIGVLHVINKRNGNFTKKDADLLMVLANQLAVVISNAKLFAEIRKKEQEARALYEVAMEISALHDLEHILNSIAHKVRYLLPCDIVGIGLPDEDSSFIRIKVWVGDRTGVLKDLVIRPGSGITGLIISSKKAQQTCFSEEISYERRSVPDDINLVAKAEGINWVLAAPMIVGEKLSGVIYACRRKTVRFSRAEIEVLQRFSSQAAIALENWRLYEKEKESIAKLKELNALSEQHRQVLQRSLDIHEHLTNLVLEGKGFEAINRTLVELVSNPVLVCDQFFKVISKAQPEGIDPELLDRAYQAVCSIVDSPQLSSMIVDLEKQKRPKRLDFLSYPAVVNPVIVGNEVLGYVVVLELTRTIADLDMVAIEHATTIVALEMMRRKTIFEVETRLKGDFLDDLLNGRLASEKEIIERANFLGYDLRKPYQVMIVDVDDFKGYIQRKNCNEQQISTLKRRIFEVIGNVVISRSPKSILVAKSDSIVLLAFASSNGPNGLLLPLQLAQAIKEGLSRAIPDLTFSVGIGRVCKDVKDFQRSYNEASVCLRIAKRFRMQGAILSHSDLGVYTLLSQVTNDQDLKEYVNRYLAGVLEYDKTHDGCLISTLRAFLNNNCNRQKTAESLYVHLNTVNYRLKRIEEISGLDILDPETRLNVHLALKALDILNQSEQKMLVSTKDN